MYMCNFCCTFVPNFKRSTNINKKMKNYLFVLLAIVFVLAGCKKKSEVEPRDAVTGSYAYVTLGQVTIKDPSHVQQLPLISQGTFDITALGDKDSVLISGAINGKMEPLKAVVKGSQLELVKSVYDLEEENFSVTLNIGNKTATMAKNTLSWETDITFEGTSSSINAIEGDGHFNLTATKK